MREVFFWSHSPGIRKFVNFRPRISLLFSSGSYFFREPTIRTLLTYKLAINSSLIHSEDNEECFVAIYMYRSVAAV